MREPTLFGLCQDLEESLGRTGVVLSMSLLERIQVWHKELVLLPSPAQCMHARFARHSIAFSTCRVFCLLHDHASSSTAVLAAGDS